MTKTAVVSASRPTVRPTLMAVLGMGVTLSLLLSPRPVWAQNEGGTAPPVTVAPAATPQTVTLDVKDAPIRTVLTQLFDKAKVDYSLDNAVSGFVTLRITDQPFENALKLILRSGSVPLSYARENGVYLVKPRPTLAASTAPAPVEAAAPDAAPVSRLSGTQFAVINLTYLDPFDLQGLLGVRILPTGTRGGGTGGSAAGSGSVGGGLPGLGGGGGVTILGGTGGNGTGGRLVGTSGGTTGR